MKKNSSLGFVNLYRDSNNRLRLSAYPKPTYLAAVNSRIDNPISLYVGTHEIFTTELDAEPDCESNYWRGMRKGQLIGFLKGVVFTIAVISLFFASLSVAV